MKGANIRQSHELLQVAVDCCSKDKKTSATNTELISRITHKITDTDQQAMASSSTETITALRAQIKGMMLCMRAEIFLLIFAPRTDNFRYVYALFEKDPIIAIATHDKLYWVIVDAKGCPHIFFSDKGHESEEGALQDMAQDLSERVWQKAKDSHITLSK